MQTSPNAPFSQTLKRYIFLAVASLLVISQAPAQSNGPYDISGHWVAPGQNLVVKLRLIGSGNAAELVEYDYVDGNMLPNRRFIYQQDKTNKNKYTRTSSGSYIVASGTRKLRFSNKRGDITYDYEKISSNTQYGNFVKKSQLAKFARNTQQTLTHLEAGTTIPGGVSTRVSTTNINLGNHIQGFTRINDDLFALTYTQHYGLDSATIADNPGVHKDLLIVAGKGVYRNSFIPTFNTVGANDVTAVGTVMVVSWQDTLIMYRVNFSDGSLKEFDTNIKDLNFRHIPGLPYKDKRVHRTWVGLVKYEGDYYLAACGGNSGNNVGIWKHRGYLRRGSTRWEFLGAQPLKLPYKRGKTPKTGGFNLVASESGLHLILNCYLKKDPDWEFVVFQDLLAPQQMTTSNIFQGTEYSSEILPQQPRSAFFRYAGGAYINEEGNLDIYAVSNVLVEGANGKLEILKRTPR